MGGNRQIAKNTAFLYLRMFVVLVVSLYTSRIVLHALGVVDYGIYNVVAGFVSLFSFLEGTLSAGIQRFYNYEQTRKGPDGFRKVYSEGLRIQAAVSAILLMLLETAGLWYVNHVMVIPPERLRAANFLFQFSSLSLLMVMMQVPFNGAIIARERMGVFAVINIIEVLLKLGIAFLLTACSSDRVILYGLLLMCVTALSTLMMIVYCRIHFQEMKWERKGDRELRKELLSFSGWSMAGTFAFLLKGQGLNLLLNWFFGPVINAARGLAYQINTAVSGFSSNITLAYRPQMVSSHAAGDNERTRKLMFSESRICFCLIALLITPVIIEMEPLLHLWLGPEVPAHTASFAALVLIDTLICTLNAPCTQVVYAVGKIRRYQIWTTLLNLCLLPVCWVLLKCGCKAEAAFTATIIFSCILQAISLVLTRQVFPFTWRSYFSEVLLRCLATAILLPVLPLAAHHLTIPAIPRVLLVCLATLVVAIPVFGLIVLNASERQFLLSRFRKTQDNE